MKHDRREFMKLLGTLPLALGLGHTAAIASKGGSYPNKPIRFIVPFSPGSSTDIAARVYADVTAKALQNASVVVENRPGAGGSIGAGAIARAAPDGYSILYSAATPIVIAPFLYPELSYDPVHDFVPIAVTTSVPLFVVVSGESDIHTMDDLSAYVQASPSKSAYGSNGVGTSGHITAKTVANALGMPDLMHVPYRHGSQGVMADVIGGRLTFAVDPWSVVGPMVEAGRLRALATTNGTRMPITPDIPTLTELFNQDLEVVTWNGLWAPAGTTSDIISQLASAVETARQDNELMKQFEAQGTPLMPTRSPTETEEFIVREVKRWERLIKATDVRLEA